MYASPQTFAISVSQTYILTKTEILSICPHVVNLFVEFNSKSQISILTSCTLSVQIVQPAIKEPAEKQSKVNYCKELRNMPAVEWELYCEYCGRRNVSEH